MSPASPGPSGQVRFSTGDRIRHLGKPEWGVGVVRSAKRGDAGSQRLSVNFPNRGILTLNTAYAPLAAPEDSSGGNPGQTLAPSKGDSSMADKKGWLDEIEGPKASERELWDLPQSLTDPFSTPQQRLEATLKTYRFNTQPGPLFEWAVIQTGLDDPLTRYTRVEMEQAFPRFARDRDQHLRDLVRDLKRKNEQAYLKQLMNKTQLPPARSALEKAIRG